MKVITAPEKYERQPGDVFIFLAGGITNCPDWQSDVIDAIRYHIADPDGNLIIFNPRRPSFKGMDEAAIIEQIEWEYKYLEQCDIFSMFFCDADSVQLICLYELGRNILRMQMRFPKDWENRLVITTEKDYSRRNDVVTQCHLAIGYDIVGTYGTYTNAIYYHVENIATSYQLINI